MPPPSTLSSAAITLSGSLQRVTYTNAENGYTVAIVKVEGKSDRVTVIGNLINPTVGEHLKMTGEWVRHPQFGRQFKIHHCTTAAPTTLYGIEKYLGSGMIKGIGPEMAKRIIERFGNKSLDVIARHPRRLAEVAGIGEKRIEMITSGWKAQDDSRDIMIFLQSQDISAGYAARIFRQYGPDAIRVVRENPYCLAEDIAGIGFTTADRIARKLGFDPDSVFRARAAVIYALNRFSEKGHVYYPYSHLVSTCQDLLGVAPAIVETAIAHVCTEKKAVVETIDAGTSDKPEPHRAVYLSHFYRCETFIADKLLALDRVPQDAPHLPDIPVLLADARQHTAITLAPRQRAAVKQALTRKVLVITGGPGTGKTTIIDTIFRLCTRMGVKTLLAAPTGRAAKRMHETTGHAARTIHRLLEFSFQRGGFQRNEERPLDCQYLIVDEASMIDTVLMYHLLKAVALDTTLILVGDVHQLPSVGAGNVLADIISSRRFTVVSLVEIFRQAAASRIIINAHRINQGRMPDLSPIAGRTDFYFRQRNDPATARDFIVKLVVDHLPRIFGFDPVKDIQVLSPMHRGPAGATQLNRHLQAALNPHAEGVLHGDHRLRVTDKVMQIKNNYDKEVFNGDMGRIHRIDPAARQIVITFDDRPVTYDFSEMDEVSLAYAISIHKSQGSEYPAVIIPILTAHYILLQRNLIYTAITRGKQLVVVVGSKKALAMAIHNDKTRQRFTRLDARLIAHPGN